MTVFAERNEVWLLSGPYGQPGTRVIGRVIAWREHWSELTADAPEYCPVVIEGDGAHARVIDTQNTRYTLHRYPLGGDA